MTPIDAGGNDVAASEVLPPDPAGVIARLIALGQLRARALTDAAVALDDATSVVRDALERGADVTIAECARAVGVARQTLYERLPAELIAGRHQTDPDL